MISVFINENEYKIDNPPVLGFSIQDRFFGSMEISLETEDKFQKYSRVLIEDDFGTYQMLVQEDRVTTLDEEGFTLHEIDLMENIAIFDNFNMADRFVSRQPIKTVADYLNILQRELFAYHNFSFNFDANDEIFNIQLKEKEFIDKNLSLVIEEIFRNYLEAKPLLKWEDGWELSYIKHSARENLFTPKKEMKMLTTESINYCTDLYTTAKNTVSELKGTWFPSKEGSVTVRVPERIGQQDQAFFEIDGDVWWINKAFLIVDYEFQGYSDDFSVIKSVALDITEDVIPKELYDILTANVPNAQVDDFANQRNKMYFTQGGNRVEGLFDAEYSNFMQTYNILARKYFPAFVEEDRENPDDFYALQTMDVYSIRFRTNYVTQRDVAMHVEKHDIKGRNKSTIRHNQSSSTIETTSYQKSLSQYVNQIGVTESAFGQTFESGETLPYLNDYTSDNKVLTSVKYHMYGDTTVITGELSKGYSPSDKDASVTRRPSAFTISRKSVQTNVVYRNYLEYSQTKKEKTGILSDIIEKVAINTFDYQEEHDKPMINAYIKPLVGYFLENPNECLHMPVKLDAEAQTMTFHVRFNHPSIAGSRLVLSDSIWQKEYTRYTDDGGRVEDFELDFHDTAEILAGVGASRQYPLVAVRPNSNLKLGQLPIDLDTQASLAFTLNLTNCTDDPDNIIPQSYLSIYNNLIDTPEGDIQIYVSDIPYGLYDKEVRSFDTLDTEAIYTVDKDVLSINIVPSLQHISKAITRNGKILLAINDNTIETIYQNNIRERLSFGRKFKLLNFNNLITATSNLIYQANKGRGIDYVGEETIKISHDLITTKTKNQELSEIANVSHVLNYTKLEGKGVFLQLSETTSLSSDLEYNRIPFLAFDENVTVSANLEYLSTGKTGIDFNGFETIKISDSLIYETQKAKALTLEQQNLINITYNLEFTKNKTNKFEEEIQITNLLNYNVTQSDPNLKWEITTGTSFNETISLGQISTCYTAQGYKSQLPNANNYTLGFRIRVTSFKGDFEPCPILYYVTVVDN